MGHWYQRTGAPIYTVPRKDGKGERLTTKRDAKKHGYLPGVTDVLDVIAKHGLTNWRIKQPLEFLYRDNVASPLDLSGMTKGDFLSYAIDGAEAESSKAPSLGSDIHNAIESYLQWLKSKRQSIVVCPEEIKPFMRVFRNWWESEKFGILSLEKNVVNTSLGYGGKLDFRGTIDKHPCYVDWKTTKFKNGKPALYPSWGCQLAAYTVADSGEAALSTHKLISVIIDSVKPGDIQVYEWENPRKYWDLFKLCMEIYKSPLGADWDPSK